MLRTVNGASQLWCPQARVTTPHLATHNVEITPGNSAYVPPGARCMADQCAMWRWESRDPPKPHIFWCDDRNAVDEPERPEYVPPDYTWCPCDSDPAAWCEPGGKTAARRFGYCGLAGRPVETDPPVKEQP